jgi:hypothetical protein
VTLAARARRAYWKHVRRYQFETCGRHDHPYEAIRRGCGRPVGLVWGAPAGIWNFVVTGERETTYTVRAGTAGGPVEERAEGVGGILCLHCFDRLALERGILLKYEARPL